MPKENVPHCVKEFGLWMTVDVEEMKTLLAVEAALQ
jgi:hypothetical protein